MSSDFSSRHLSSDDLDVLQKLLAGAGYSDDSVTDGPASKAAKLLIGLFQEGVTDPADLARELERRFGRPSALKTVGPTLHQYAISGVPDGYVQPRPSLHAQLSRYTGPQAAL